MSTSIFQSQAAQSWLYSGIAVLLLVTLNLSRTKVDAHIGLETEGVLELVAAHICSRVVARLFKTWLWCQLYHPWVRLTLHLVRICLKDADLEQKAQLGSSPHHCWRFTGVGRTSYVALIIKLSHLDSMLHRCFHLSFLLSMLSHLVHYPCLPSETTLVHLATCSWCLTLFTTILLCSAAEALLQVGWQAVNPRPPFPCWADITGCLYAWGLSLPPLLLYLVSI